MAKIDQDGFRSAAWMTCLVLACSAEGPLETAEPQADEMGVHIDFVETDASSDANPSEGELGTLRQALSTNKAERDDQWTYFSWGDAIGGVDCPDEGDWYDLSINSWAAWWYGINEQTFVGGKISAHNTSTLFPASQTRCSGKRHDILMRYAGCSGGALGCTSYHALAADIGCINLPFTGKCNVGLIRVKVDLDRVINHANASGINPDVMELYTWCHEFGHALGLDHNNSTTGPDYTCMVSGAGATATHINNWYANGATGYYKNDEYKYVSHNYDESGIERNCSGTCNPL